MKKRLAVIAMALFIVNACGRKESPAEQKQKTESAITDAVNVGAKLENNNAILAIESMPGGSPIEGDFPGKNGAKGIIANIVKGRVPFFKKNITKSPIDSIEGTWEYDESTGIWNHTSSEPRGEVILIWHFAGADGVTHVAKVEFKNLAWSGDTILTGFDVDEYIDNSKVASLSYDYDIHHKVELSGTIVGIVDFYVKVEAADGHTLDEDDFYGTVHLSVNDLNEGNSFSIDITYNEDGSWTFNIVMNDNGEDWQMHFVASAPDEFGRQNVSGYIRNGDVETARIEGTIIGGDFTEVYVIYADGTRVSLASYISGLNIGS